MNTLQHWRIDLYDAIQIAIEGWKVVNEETIVNCWRHCNIRNYNNVTEPLDPALMDVDFSILQLENLTIENNNQLLDLHYSDPISLEQLDGLENNNNIPTNEQIIEAIQFEDIESDDDFSIVIPRTTNEEAIAALKIIIKHTEEAKTFNNQVQYLIQSQNRLKELNTEELQAKKQQKITSFLPRVDL